MNDDFGYKSWMSNKYGDGIWNEISTDDQIYMFRSFGEEALSLLDNNKHFWNSAIDTMMEVIELQPLIDQSNKNRIQEIAKGLKK